MPYVPRVARVPGRLRLLRRGRDGPLEARDRPLPTVTKPAVAFYLAMKFNPSPMVLKMRGLYDGRRERVRGSEGANLTWVSDDAFDEAAAEEVRAKFGL